MDCCDHDHEQHDHEHHQHHHEGHSHQQDHEQNHERQPSEQTIVQQQKKAQLLMKKRKAEAEVMKKKSAQLKKKYLPLLRFLKKNGLQFKTASYKRVSVSYFRMDQFRKLLVEKQDKIAADSVVSELLKGWQGIFIYFKRIDSQPHLKWPVELENSKQGPNSKFAAFPFDPIQSSKTLTILAIIGILVLLCFPLWPYEVKYYIWVLSLWSTVFFVAVVFLRLILYLLGAIFGGSLWIFPRLLQNCGLIQSWIPLYSWKWWEGTNIYSVATRVAVLGIFIYYGVHIYSDPDFIKENLDITKTIIDDINEWGIAKMKGQRNFSQSALTDYSQLLNSTLAEEENEQEAVESQKSFQAEL